MRARIVILLYFVIGLTLTSNAQSSALSSKITYSCQQKTIREILIDIEKISGIRFTYNNAVLKDSEITSISVQQKTLLETLQILFKNQYSFKQIGNQILITQVEQDKSKSKAETKPKIKKPTVIYDTIRIIDSVKKYTYDTINITIFDTITYVDTIKPIVKNRNKNTLSISINSGPIYSVPIFANRQNTIYSTQLQNAVKPDIGSITSIGIRYKKHNVVYGSGFSYLNLKYNSNFTTSYTINDGSISYVDTLWYWKYNKLFTYYKFNNNGDSVAITVYDSLYTYQLKNNPKKIEKVESTNSPISLQYISIPISLGYKYAISKDIEIQPSIALQTYIATVRKGKIPNITNTKAIGIETIIAKKIIWGGVLSCNTNFKFHENYAISFNPMVIFSPSIYKSNETQFQQIITSFGFEWGLTYMIPYELF